MSYIEVTSKDPDDNVVYSHSAWVDNDPRLHEVLMQHHWSLNQRTGHLQTHTLTGLLLEAMEAQGPVPTIVPLPRALAAAVANGRKIARVHANPTDYRYESLLIEWERGVVTFTPPPVEAEGRRELMTSRVQAPGLTAQRRADSERRRQEADERRRIAEQRAERRHFDRIQAEVARNKRRAERIAGKSLKVALQAQAQAMLEAAQRAGEPWAKDAYRIMNGYAPEGTQPIPEIWSRFNRGLPELVEQSEAQVEDPKRYKESCEHFEDFCSAFRQRLSVAAMRKAWVKAYPEHDWVRWHDDATIPGAGKYDPPVAVPGMSVTPRLAEPTPVPLLAPSGVLTPREEELKAEFEALWNRGKFPEEMDVASEDAWQARIDASDDRFEKQDMAIERHQERKNYQFAQFLKGKS